MASLAVPRKTSSWTFVISRHAARRRSPSTSAMSASVASRRCGASNRTSVARRDDTPLRAARRAFGVRGRKPRNWNVSAGNPETASAAVTADGPGTLTTPNPARATSATSAAPGSLTPGAPASVTSATSSSRSASSNCGCPLPRVVLVVADDAGGQFQVAQQFPRLTCVLCSDQRYLGQHTRCARRQVFQVPDRRRYDVERSGHGCPAPL